MYRILLIFWCLIKKPAAVTYTCITVLKYCTVDQYCWTAIVMLSQWKQNVKASVCISLSSKNLFLDQCRWQKCLQYFPYFLTYYFFPICRKGTSHMTDGSDLNLNDKRWQAVQVHVGIFCLTIHRTMSKQEAHQKDAGGIGGQLQKYYQLWKQRNTLEHWGTAFWQLAIMITVAARFYLNVLCANRYEEQGKMQPAETNTRSGQTGLHHPIRASPYAL